MLENGLTIVGESHDSGVTTTSLSPDNTSPKGLRRLLRSPLSWAFLGAVTLALVYARSVLLHLGEGVIGGDGDGFENLWNNWWVKKSLLDLHTSPFFTDYIYYPTGVSLRYHTLNPFDGLVTMPFSLLIGFMPTLNIFFIVSLALSVYCAFLLLYDLVGNTWAAFAGAGLYTFANEHVVAFFAQGQSEKLSMEWLPLYFFFMLRALHGRPMWLNNALIARDSRRWPVYMILAVAVLVIMSLVDWQYVMFAAFSTALYLLYLLFTRRTARGKAIIVGKLAAIGAIYAALVFPTMLLPMIREAAESPWLNVSEQAVWHSIDLARLLSPWSIGNPGYLTVVVGVAGLWLAFRKRGFEREIAVFWGIAVLLFYLLSLGPTLQFNGRDTGIALPYSLLQDLPVFSSGRNPGRFTLVALTGLAILTAFGLRELTRFLGDRLTTLRFSPILPIIWRHRAVAAIVTFLFLTITLAGFFSAAGDTRVDSPDWPPFYQQIAADTDNYAILELPLFTDLGLGEQHYQVFQVLHNKPRFGGRWARDHKLTNPNNFVKHASLFRQLLFLGYSDNQLAEAYPETDFLRRTDYRTQGAQILSYYKVRYIVLYKDALNPDLFAEYDSIVGEILGSGISPYYDDGGMRVYMVGDVPSAANPLTLDVGDGWFAAQTNPSGKVYRWANSADDQPSELYSMNLTQGSVAAALHFTAYTWQKPRTLHVALNGMEVATIPLSTEEGEKPLTIPLTIPPGNNIISFASPEPPEPTGQPKDGRKLSFGMYGVALIKTP